jgi:2-dehydro-3-deoxyphosphooctonate aldolase (KDO 8-P synthase)
MRIIVGPCAIESLEHALFCAELLKHMEIRLKASGYRVEFVYKSSYSKANRTKKSSFHGVGLEKGLEILRQVKEQTGLRVTSDVHTVEEIEKAQEVLDIIQIPHQMCRNTELLEAAARTGRIVSVKKGTFMKPESFAHVVDKIREAGNKRTIIAIERGNCYGHSDIVVDMRSINTLNNLRSEGVSVCIDATHSALDRKYAPIIAKASVAAGADSVFIEAHEEPDKAPCDGPCMLDFKDLEELIKDLCRIQSANHNYMI